MSNVAPSDLADALSRLRAARPLVQNITNLVVMDISANALLALGASPAMVHGLDETEDFAAIAQGLVCNIGTLSPEWVASMRLAAQVFSRAGKGWVLDPVGCGATPYRTRAAGALAALGPAVIRGNASEIASLAGAGGHAPKGVDNSASAEDAIAPARVLARSTGGIVAITGPLDLVTDGLRTVSVGGGSPLMTLVTGVGCALSAAIAAFVAVERDPLVATTAALAAFKIAGSRAAVGAEGPGAFRPLFLDALHALAPSDLAAFDGVRAA